MWTTSKEEKIRALPAPVSFLTFRHDGHRTTAGGLHYSADGKVPCTPQCCTTRSSYIGQSRTPPPTNRHRYNTQTPSLKHQLLLLQPAKLLLLLYAPRAEPPLLALSCKVNFIIVHLETASSTKQAQKTKKTQPFCTRCSATPWSFSNVRTYRQARPT